VSVEVGDDVGRIEFPLDHVALVAQRVGARSGAELWVASIDSAWQLAGGAPLQENACDTVRTIAARALGRLQTTASKPTPIEVLSSRRKTDCLIEAITDRPIPAFEAERYQPHPMTPNYSERFRHWRDLVVGDRVHVFGELDAEVIDITSHRLGGGVIVRLRTADGRVIFRRPPEVQLAPERDVIVTLDGQGHTIAAATEALDSAGPHRYGVALIALLHTGCSCTHPLSLKW
jgi:hypothetical protein